MNRSPTKKGGVLCMSQRIMILKQIDTFTRSIMARCLSWSCYLFEVMQFFRRREFPEQLLRDWPRPQDFDSTFDNTDHGRFKPNSSGTGVEYERNSSAQLL